MENKLNILKMLEAGEITAAEAEALLEALESEQDTSSNTLLDTCKAVLTACEEVRAQCEAIRSECESLRGECENFMSEAESYASDAEDYASDAEDYADDAEEYADACSSGLGNGGQIPFDLDALDEELKAVALAMPGKVEAKMNELKVADAIDEIFVLLRRANKYIDETMPWALAKDESKHERLGTVLYNLLEAIRFAAIALEPYLPDTSKRILEQLNIGNGGLESLTSFGGMVAGEKVGTPEILFARLDPVKKMEEINAINEAKAKEKLP